MKNGSKLALGCAGLVVAGALLVPQTSFAQTQTNNANLTKIVTKRFENADVHQVLAWLVEQGFSYVANESDFGSARVTLNIDHAPLIDTAQALADALGGHWRREGKVFVFHRGPGNEWAALDGLYNESPNSEGLKNFRIFAAPQGVSPNGPLQDLGKVWSEPLNKRPDGMNPDQLKALRENARELQNQAEQMKALSGDQMKALRDNMKVLKDQAGAEQNLLNGDQMKALRDNMKALKDQAGTEQNLLNSDQMKALRDNMKQLQGQMKVYTIPDLPMMQGFQKTWSVPMTEEQRKALQEMVKQLDGKAGTWNEHQWEDFGKKMEEWAKKFSEEYGNMPHFVPPSNLPPAKPDSPKQ